MSSETPLVDNNLSNEFDRELERARDPWDQFGILLSTLCAIHCLVVPLLLVMMPLVGEHFENPVVHWLMALFVIPVGLYAFLSGYRHHRNVRVTGTGIFGLALILVGAALPHHWLELLGYDVVTILGSLFLLAGHYLNRRACLCHPHLVAHPANHPHSQGPHEACLPSRPK